jgi:hypothetical protein
MELNALSHMHAAVVQEEQNELQQPAAPKPQPQRDKFIAAVSEAFAPLPESTPTTQ